MSKWSTAEEEEEEEGDVAENVLSYLVIWLAGRW
jgi:hypothetical protein